MKNKGNMTPSDYLKITEMKAAGLEVDMYLGAVLGRGTDNEVKIIAKVGRTLGILATLRDDLIDVFDIEELSQRVAVNDLPLPLIFAMQDPSAKEKIENILSKPKMTEDDVSELVDITLTAKPVKELTEKMQSLIKAGLVMTSQLTNRKTAKLHAFLSFMMEDLQ
jgi:geranylgeranyl diphosphate synthase, type I